MLHFSAINSPTLELLRKLQQTDLFSELRLVGGTALALQIGHRKSVDLDLFGNLAADDFEVSLKLNELGNVKIAQKTNNILVCFIDEIKVDIVNYHYPWIDEPVRKENLLLASPKDIAAMKLAAITGRGSKKDFVDIYFLLQYFSLIEMMELYKAKYDDGNPFLVLKSLIYFDDAESDPLLEMLIPLDWEEVKLYIKTKVGELD